MSVTTVLVPVLEPEAEALLGGGEPARGAEATIVGRARTLRARVARVDAIREELHDLLFAKWQGGREAPGSGIARFFSAFRKPQPAKASTGYDPFVHLFGRSLPVNGESPKAVAEALSRALHTDDAAFEQALATQLGNLDLRAAERFRAAPAVPPPAALEAAIAAEIAAIEPALASPESLKPALDAVARLSAWSQPVWRFDGEMLPSLLATLGIGVVAGRAGELFSELFLARPALEPLANTLPVKLGDFSGAGAFLTSGEVKVLAGSLRLQRLAVAKNAAESGENAELVMRHARLLEEAVLYCESEGLALLEAAGVEWHDRRA